MRHATISITALSLCAAALAAPEPSPTPAPKVVVPGWVILGRDLTATPAQVITRVTSSQITFTTTAEGEAKDRPLSQVSAIVPDAWYNPARAATTSPQPPFSTLPSEGLITLTDGSRFVGRPRVSTQPDTISWVSPLLGEFTVKIDLVSSIALGAADLSKPAAAGVAKADRIVLNNGDSLAGFISSMASTTGSTTELAVTIEPQTASGAAKSAPLTIPFSRIRSLSLANPQAKAAGKAPFSRVYFADGSIAPATAIDLSSEQALTIVYPTNLGHSTFSRVALAGNIVGIAFPGQALTPLASLPITRQQPEKGRRWSLPVTTLGASTHAEPLSAADVLIPGPMSVTWTLPPKTTRMAGALVLPEDCRTWGDCTVTITTAGTGAAAPLLTKRLNAAEPIADFNFALPPAARELQVTVTSGDCGPIQNQVILRRTVLLSDTDPR